MAPANLLCIIPKCSLGTTSIFTYSSLPLSIVGQCGNKSSDKEIPAGKSILEVTRGFFFLKKSNKPIFIFLRFSFIILKPSNALSRFFTISSANTSGSVLLSRSANLSFLVQALSRVGLVFNHGQRRGKQQQC